MEPFSPFALLDGHCAARGRGLAKSAGPLRLHGALPPSMQAACVPLERQRRCNLDRDWMPEASHPNHSLHNGLIALGGECTIIANCEPDLAELMVRGQVWGRTTQTVRGVSGRCHSNVCSLWEANQDRFFIATGYALSDDGIWRQHSWCVEPRPRSMAVIETTMPRELYFGFVMTLEETACFIENNAYCGARVLDETRARYDALGALAVASAQLPHERERARG